ncbi:hypothetical protein PVAND_008558 [Polypedilum vanderplanki]|uniref:G-protein coupled receptors family 1 profile domain-containing protein n=1 Tax=Polypedilum vanderplanki TaxID=319348 RepID=A0A9J6CB15_POLVA|nr:hypothetical protein PVAND_008558 [Polypedilum vanderplanki]
MTIMTSYNYSNLTSSHSSSNDSSENGNIDICEWPDPVMYDSIIGISLAMPQWEAIGTAVILTLIIIFTIVGNVLVILSVFTYKPLRIVQNFFIVSLAVADLTVAILVLPLNVAYSIRGRWDFGIHICKMWLTSDVLCCTASILNLCAIALDRYWAITDPINYAQKRTMERVLILITGVWLLSLLISSPPLLGWNDWPDHFDITTPCQLTTKKSYVIYSALGSFFIPLIIMTIVYIEIYIATRRRLRERAQASKINAMALKSNMTAKTVEQTTNNSGSGDRERESISSETADGVATLNSKDMKRKKKKDKKKMAKDSIKDHKKNKAQLTISNENSVTDIHENENNPNDTKSSVIEIDKNNAKLSEVTTMINNNNNNNNPTCHKKSGAVYQFIEEKQKISLSKERRAARTLGIIMGVFVVCWLPFFLMYVIGPFCASCCISDKLVNFITWLGYINSCFNPIIYSIFNMEFRKAFKKLLGIKP